MNEYDSNGLDKGIVNMNPLPKGEQSELPECNGGPIGGTPINNGDNKVKRSYLVTIKCHAKVYVSQDELDRVLAETKNKVNASRLKADWSSIVGYEEDSLGRMHLHTFLVTEKAIFMKKYQKPGWSIHFQDRKAGKYMTGKRALRYITKLDQSSNAVKQRFDENYYRFVNRFLPESLPEQPALLDQSDQADCKSAEGFCRVLRSDTR